MIVAVTGANGFIGSQLCRALIHSGHRVRALVRTSSDLHSIQQLPVEPVIGDVRDEQSLHAAFDGCNVVFQTAAIVSFWKPLHALQHEVNVHGTHNVVTAALRCGVGRLVHTSSIAALGHAEDGLLADETTPFNWDASQPGYKKSKHDAELEILHGIGNGLDAVIVNPAVVIGPGDVHFNGGDFIRSVSRGFVPFYIRGGANIVFVEDVVRGQIAAAEKGEKGERYILGGENLTHRQIFQTIAQIVGKPEPRIPLPVAAVKVAARVFDLIGVATGKKPMLTSELTAGAGLHNWYSSAKAERELGYTITPFQKAVELTYRWYKEMKLL
ncbi:MAG: SDR family oxidoreductase [Ignavibacteriales bacterium]|nr:SDR family oxidoreductase [Ignavibacteriales bacterium]